MDESTQRAAAPEGFHAGSFGCHEALHMTAALAAMVDRELVEHPAIAGTPEWRDLAARAADALGQLYQEIGTTHLDGMSDAGSYFADPLQRVR